VAITETLQPKVLLANGAEDGGNMKVRRTTNNKILGPQGCYHRGDWFWSSLNGIYNLISIFIP